MADEIKIACNFWPNPITNPNAVWDYLDQANDQFVPVGIRLKDDEIADICFEMNSPVPTNYGGTPAPKLRICWKTASADTVNVPQFIYKLKEFTPEVDSEDPSTWTIDSTATDASAGAYIENQKDIDISAVTFAIGDRCKGVLRRDARSSNSNDTLVADIVITDIFFIAST